MDFSPTKPCECPDDHLCENWGVFPLVLKHGGGTVKICPHCFGAGHGWRHEEIGVYLKDDFPEGPDTIWFDHVAEHQREHERWHGTSA